MRRARRDPQSPLVLRRLAYRAPRDPAARYVLVDALLETVPVVFERYMEQAHKEDARSGLEQIVWFRPKKMYPYKGSPGASQKGEPWTPVTWFFLASNPTGSSTSRTIDIERHMKKPSGGRGTIGRSAHEQDIVIVYRTRGKL